ncbi:MAG: TetR/AcrR family transcriptional regulator [Rhodothalassiaceae bacterium]
MARPEKQSDQQIRQAALVAFRRDGYADTSLAKLEAATQLGRRSLFNRYGDKKGLFVRALKDFAYQAAATYLAPLAAEDAGLDALADTLRGLARAGATAEGRAGCLICNTAREPIAADPEIAAVLTGYFRRIETGAQAALTRAHVATADRLACFFLAQIVALCVLARAGADEETLNTVAEEAIRHLTGARP